MKTHSQLGFDLLSRSQTAVHQLAASVALEHHERWDGSGYPQGLSGERISLAARLTAVADVLDSLMSPSCYKTPWTLQDSLEHLRSESGKHFEPRLIELVLNHPEEIAAVYKEAPANPVAAT